MEMRPNMLKRFPNFLTIDSIFQKMVVLGAPWTNAIGKSMDIAYFTMYSGLKTPSYFVYLNSNNDGTPNTLLISQILWDLYGKNWEKLWNAFNSQYNPIENYSIDESITRNSTDNRTIEKKTTFNSSVDGTGEENSSDSGSSTLEHGHVIDDSRTVNDYTYGFNSNQQVPTNVQTQTGKETNSGSDVTKTSNTGKVDTSTTSTREDEGSDNTTDNNIGNETITRSRSGNVGQNSYQELLRQEFELWKWNFFYQVFDDVDKMLCLSVFDPCSSVN